jgi:hypothetical protein
MPSSVRVSLARLAPAVVSFLLATDVSCPTVASRVTAATGPSGQDLEITRDRLLTCPL